MNRYDDARRLCANLGGKMALEIGQDFQQTVGNPTKCDDNIKYWLPIKLDRYSEGHYHWSGDQYFDGSDTCYDAF